MAVGEDRQISGNDMSLNDPTAVELADALTTAVEKILQTANTIPVKLVATYQWVESTNYEELVPLIEISWQPSASQEVRVPIPCDTCKRFENDGNCPNHAPLMATAARVSRG